MEKFYVIGITESQVGLFSRTHNIPMSQIKHVNDVQYLFGLDGVEIILLDGFHRSRVYQNSYQWKRLKQMELTGNITLVTEYEFKEKRSANNNNG